jgi:signal transduction histidine kinase
MLSIALFVIMRQKHPVYIAFATTIFAITIWLALQFISFFMPNDPALWVTRFSLLASNFVTPLFLIFAILYPKTENTISIKKTILILMPVVALSCLSFLPDMVKNAEHKGYDLILQTGFLYDIQTVLSVGYIIAALVVLLWKYKFAIHKDRVAILMLFFAFLFPLVVGVLANYIWINVAGTHYLLPITLFVTFLIITYAIVRHGLFDIRLVVARAVGYALLLVTLLVLYAGAIFSATQLLFGGVEGVTSGQSTVYFIFAILLAFTFNPLRRFFDKVTNHIFYRRDYDPQKVLSDIGDIMANEINLKQLSDGIIRIIRTALESEFVNLHIKVNDSSHKFYVGKSVGVFSDSLVEHIDHYPKKIILTDYIEESHKHLQSALNKLGVGAVVRLDTSREHVGYLILGAKKGGGIYNAKDDQFFRSIGNELALAIQNSLRFEEIQTFNTTLQQRIEEATKELRRTNTQLQRLDEAKDEFVSMASHQLRTPLTSVKGYISMVLEGDAGKITATQRQLLGEAFTSSERMVHLIGDFLNVSRLQTGKFMLDQRPVDLTKVVTQEVDSLQTTVDAHNLKLIYRPPSHFPLLRLDEGKVRQVLMNFIDNAIYYSQEGMTITVKLSMEGPDVVLRVRDSGIGVPKAERAHLFTKFFRATNARKQRPDGTGVGLFLAKKVITAHGGTMVFESEEGKGSTFGFRLPIKSLSDDHADKLGK